MLRNTFLLLTAYIIIIVLTIHCTNVNGDKTIEVAANGDETTIPSNKELLQKISDEMLIKEIRRRGYKVKKRQKYNNYNNKDNKKTQELKRKARELNDNAISQAQSGDLWNAISKFKQLVQVIPDSSEYWNNLGVTQMRASVYHTAEASFRKAIEIDATYVDAQENLNVLKSYLPHTKPHRESRPIKHVTRKAKRIHIKELLTNYKYKDYADGKKPFFLVGAMENAVALQKWKLRYLNNLFPNAMMDHYPQNMFREAVKPRFVPIAHAFEDMLLSSSNMSVMYKDKPGVYIQWNLDYESWHKLMNDFNDGLPKMFRVDDEWMNKCFKSDETRSEWQRGTHWRMLLIGSQGSGMFGHKDILRTSSWQAQISGYKRWHLCGPAQDKYMYKAGDVDAFDPDYERYPDFQKINCIDDIAAPGEMIFYPKDYWHQTETWPDSEGNQAVSVTGTGVDAQNYREVQAELERECGPYDNRRISLSENVCRDLKENCFSLWKNMWS